MEEPLRVVAEFSNPKPEMLPAVGEKPIDKLVRDLNVAFSTHGEGDTIRRIMETYVSTHTDWKEYAHFGPHKYSRNLVARTPKFELMVICWGEGQVSPIHNHEGQRCWMGALDGRLEETYFIFQNTRATKGSGPLEKTDVRVIEKGTVGYITDDIALHVIRPVTTTAVSLHLYSLPIPECNVYDSTTGTLTRRRLGFFTEFKKPVPQDSACWPSK
jgi:cysteine dioxygenase